MIRALESEEVERILRAEVLGRIGCYAGDRTYVVPVCYVYQDGSIYAHSRYGQKIEMMRQNPSVCFEVEHVEDLVNWCSAASQPEPCSGQAFQSYSFDPRRSRRSPKVHA